METFNPPLDSITLDKMDYKYIDGCKNEKELERILRALRSGKEGYYPHLINHCEKKLESINPDSRALRKPQPPLGPRDLKQEELKELTEDMQSWKEEMNEINKPKLENHINGYGDHGNLPPVRSAKTLKGIKKSDVNVSKEDGKKSQRIKSGDYKSWDEYDVDDECKKIDESDPVTADAKKVDLNLSDNLDSSGLNEVEKELKASREKEKGNEAFKSGDFEEALLYYSRSISLLPSAASFNNRALVYLRLKKWKEAETDCNTVLNMEGEWGNIKAMLRRATSYKNLGKYREAISDLEFVMNKEPNNARARSILEEVKKIKMEDEKENSDPEETPVSSKQGKKMIITEVEGESDSEEEDLTKFHDAKAEVAPTPGEQDQKEELGEETRSVVSNEIETAPQTVENPIPQVIEPKFPTETNKLKSEAGLLFKSGQYGNAGDLYTKAIENLKEFVEGEQQSDQAYKIALAVLHNNRAACWLKQGNDRACIDDCSTVLETKEWDVKALMRRATAYEHMEKYMLAYVDFKSAESIDWNNPLAQDGANRAANHLRQVYGNKWRDKIPPIPLFQHRSNVTTDSGGSQAPQVKISQNEVPKENFSCEKPNKEPDSEEQPEKTDGKSITSEESPKERKDSETNETQKTAGKSKPRKRNRKSSKSKNTEKKMEEPTPHSPTDAEKEAKKAQIRKDLFEKLKAEGNDHVKKSDFSSAIDCYTRCITLCPKEPASYTNRALCLLKKNKNVSAANDCTEAIKLDPVNVKAYYRRFQARKAEGLYSDAQRDLQKLLEIDPGNKLALAERKKLSALIKPSQEAKSSINEAKKADINASKKVQSSKPVKKQMVIEEVSSSSSDEGEFVLPVDDQQSKKVQTKPSSPSENREIHSKSKPSISNQDKTNVISNTKLNPTGNTGDKGLRNLSQAPQSNMKVSRDHPLTPFEFGSLWNSIGRSADISQYKEILDMVAPQRLPEVLSNKIDDHVISVVAKVAQVHIEEENNPQRAFDIMLHVSKSKRFDMAVMFLSNLEKEALCSTFSMLTTQKDVAYSQEDLKSLRKNYNL